MAVYEALATASLALSDLTSGFTSISATIAETLITGDLARNLYTFETAVNNSLALYEGSPTIDVGSGATNYSEGATHGVTIIDLSNPANASGTITSVQVYASIAMTGFRIGSFYLKTGITYKCRASSTIGNVTAGSVQTFPVSFSVQSGDFIGAYWDVTGGIIRVEPTGGSGCVRIIGEILDAGDEGDVWQNLTNYRAALYGTGIIYAPSITLSISSLATDSLALRDAISAGLACVAIVSEQLKLTDNPAPQIELNITADDTLALKDVARTIADLFGNAVDSIVFNDSPIGVIPRVISLTVKMNAKSLVAMMNELSLTMKMKGQSFTTEMHGRTLTVKMNNRNITIAF